MVLEQLAKEVLNSFEFKKGSEWMSLIINHLDLLTTLLGAQFTDLAKPIIRLMTHGQVSTFLQEVFKFLAFILAAEMANLLVASTKHGQVLPGREKRCWQPISQCSHNFPGLPHLRSDGSKWIASNRHGGLFGEPSLA